MIVIYFAAATLLCTLFYVSILCFRCYVGECGDTEEGQFAILVHCKTIDTGTGTALSLMV